MSNEEIVLLVQKGEDRYLELWDQNKGIIHRKAWHVLCAMGDSPWVELEDLVQSAFLGLVAAVQDYKPGEWKFTTYLDKRLKTAFAEATGYRTKKVFSDPLRKAVSLDAPLDDEDGGTLADIVPDPNAAATISEAEERIWHDQLREILGEMMLDMPEAYADTLYRRFWKDQTYEKAGEELGIAGQSVRLREYKGLRYLKQPQNRKKLRPFYEFDCYSGTGMGAYRSSGASVQERYVMWND